MIGVYLIKHLASGKVYVGSSIDIPRRLKAHLSNLRNGTHRNSHLQRAWNKYGEDAFFTDVLAVTDKDALIETEQKWIDLLKAAHEEYGYNACPIAESVGSLPKSAEHRAKIGAAHKGKKRSAEAKARMSAAMRGKNCTPLSPEQKAKISKANTGKVRTAVMRDRISKAKAGLKTGPCTEERRQSISKAKTGKPLSDHHKRRIKEGLLAAKNKRINHASKP